VELLEDVLDQADFVLLMSVNPGFAGQPFLPRALDKARRLREMIRRRGLAVDISMDGGIDRDNMARVVAAGVDTCIVGSGIFAAEDPVARMKELRSQAPPETV
jgi:ribulose-phosphate 3-epimerase